MQKDDGWSDARDSAALAAERSGQSRFSPMKNVAFAIISPSLLGAVIILVVGCGRASHTTTLQRPDDVLAAAREAKEQGEMLPAAALYRSAIEGCSAPAAADAIRKELALELLQAAAAPDSPSAVGEQAIEASEDVLRRSPECVEVQRALGRRLVQVGRFADAREHIVHGLEGLAPASPEGIASAILLARSWEGTGHSEEAMAIVAPIVGFDPVSRRMEQSAGAPEGTPTTDAYLILERILRAKRNDGTAADGVLARCAERNPHDVVAWIETARWRESIGDPQGARDAVQSAIRLAPTDPAVLQAEVDRCLKDRDGPRSAAALVRLREAAPRAISTFQLAARHLAAHGTASEAIDHVADSIVRFGRRLERQTLPLAKLAMAVKIPADERPTLLERLDSIRVGLGGAHPFPLILEARVLLLDRHWNAAAKCLAEARALTPLPVRNTVCLMLGRCHDHLGSCDEGLSDLQQVDRSVDASQSIRADSGALLALSRLGRRATLRSDSATLMHAVSAKSSRSDTDADGAIVALVAAQLALSPPQREWGPLALLLENRLAASPESTGRFIVPRAAMLEARGDSNGAIVLLQSAAETQPHDADVTAARIRTSSRHRGVDEALRFEAGVTANTPEASAVLIAAAVAVAGDSGPDTAWISDFTHRAEALASDVDAGEVLIAVADLADRAGEWNNARDALVAAAKRLPDDSRAPLALSRGAAFRGDVATARRGADDVARIDGPTAPSTRVATACAAVARAVNDTAAAAGALGEARALLIEAESDRPGWSLVQEILAGLEQIAGNQAAAITRLQQARLLGPPDGDIDRRLASALVARARYAEAELIAGTVACPSFPGAVKARIDEDLRLGFIDACIERSMRICPPATATADELVWLARLQAKGGRTKESHGALGRAVEIAADRPDAWLWLVASHVSAGERDAAEEILGRALAAAPADERTLLAARGASILGRLEDAGRDFLAAVEADNGRIEPAGHAVDFFLRHGRSKEAESVLRLLLGDTTGRPAPVHVATWAAGRLATLRSDTPGGNTVR